MWKALSELWNNRINPRSETSWGPFNYAPGLSQGKKWKWGSNSIVQVKGQLTNAPGKAYFTKDAITRLETDASRTGLGAILEHQQPDG